jgi:hypothetical protein
MKRVKLEHTEPKVTVEMSLSEMKFFRDVLGAFSPREVKERLELYSTPTHPNFMEQMLDMHSFFKTGVEKVLDETTIGESSWS